MKNYQRSQELYERACRVLAGGVSSEFRKFSTPHPLFYARGEGSRIEDVDGNVFLDFTLSQGPLILGHSHPRVQEAVENYSRQGQLFAGQHMAELELAEKLQALIPCAQMMRFSLSGSECDHTALRLARAATGKQKFLRFEGHYHGWFDNVAVGISGTEEQLGDREHPNPVPWTQGLPARVEEELIVLPWNDLDLVRQTVEEYHQELAAIVTEPVMCNNGCIPPRPGFLEGLRELCDQYNIVLIFDEVITGFRLGLGGAQKYFGVTPDLAVFGKAMASGYPIAIICGQEKWMRLIADGTVIHAGTMNSCNPCVAAALATVQVLEDEDVHRHLFNLGTRLRDGLAEMGKGHGLLVQGPGPMFHTGFSSLEHCYDYRDTLQYDKARYGAFVRGMQERGVRLIGRGLWYISAAHSEEDIDTALSAAAETLQEVATS
jgi:glutamate-1-semialdehyde 2,1-aminomutase